MELRAHHSCKFEDDLEQAGYKAAIRYLRHVGYDVVDQEAATQAGLIDLVAFNECGALTFTTIYVGLHRMPSVRSIDDEARFDLERRAMSWLSENEDEYSDVSVTFDVVYVGILSPHRVMVRHHRNILAMPWDQERPTDDESGLAVGPYVPGFRLNTPINDGKRIKASDVEDPDGELIPDTDEAAPSKTPDNDGE